MSNSRNDESEEKLNRQILKYQSQFTEMAKNAEEEELEALALSRTHIDKIHPGTPLGKKMSTLWAEYREIGKSRRETPEMMLASSGLIADLVDEARSNERSFVRPATMGAVSQPFPEISRAVSTPTMSRLGKK